MQSRLSTSLNSLARYFVSAFALSVIALAIGGAVEAHAMTYFPVTFPSGYVDGFENTCTGTVDAAWIANVYFGDPFDTSTLYWQYGPIGGGGSVSCTTLDNDVNTGWANLGGQLDVDNATSGPYWISVSSNDGDFYTLFDWDGTTPDPVPSSTITRIVSTDPVASSTAATGTPVTIGAEVYINNDDYEEGMYLQLSFTNQTVENVGGFALDAWNSAFGVGADIKIPITATSSVVSYSTTTEFSTIGVTHATYKIVKPTFLSSLWFVGDLFNGDVLAVEEFDFVLGAKSGLDLAIEQGANAVADYILTGTTTTPVLNCNPFDDFEITACLVSLVIPSSDVMRQNFDNLYNGLLIRFPIGYVTRFMAIMTNTDQLMPPAMTYTFGTASPQELQGKTYSVQIFEHFDVLTAARTDTGNNKNIWDITMPYFRTVMSFAVLLVFLTDLVGFRFAHDKTQYGNVLTAREERLAENPTDYSDMSEAEWRNAKRNRLI